MKKHEEITVRTAYKHFSAETLVVEFDKMSVYISENVNISKITARTKIFIQGA